MTVTRRSYYGESAAAGRVDDAGAGEAVVRELAARMQARGERPQREPDGRRGERAGQREAGERVQREGRQEPQPAERVAGERAARSRQVFIGSVWPPCVQNQTKYAPTTSAIQPASRLR